jgi:hypothetical protein
VTSFKLLNRCDFYPVFQGRKTAIREASKTAIRASENSRLAAFRLRRITTRSTASGADPNIELMVAEKQVSWLV